jgi:hypothetical protein
MSHTSAPPSTVPVYAYAACGAPYANVRRITNQDELTSAIAGDWYLCGSQSAFCATDEFGLKVEADGSWSTLYRGTDDAIVEAPSSDTRHNGIWVPSFEATSRSNITNIGFRFASGGGYITFAQFSEGGEQMVLTNTVCTATYVKSTALESTGVAHNTINGIAVELNPTTATIDSQALAQCDPNKSNFDSTSLDTMQNALTGLWMLCPAAGAACSSGEVGIQFDVDGRWYNLYADGRGLVYRGLGSGRRGDYQLSDNDSNPKYYSIISQTYGDPLWNYSTDLNATGSLVLPPTRFAPICSGYYQKL